jgi:hypothetical protein
MSEGVDELLVERNLFKFRSKEYRERCAHLESKNNRLKDMVKQSRSKERETERKCQEEVSDLDARLSCAIDTIEAFKEELKQQKIQYRELLCAFNDRTAEARYIRDGADHLNIHYDVARTILLKTTEEKDRLEKEVGDLRRLNIIFMEEIKRLNKQLNE